MAACCAIKTTGGDEVVTDCCSGFRVSTKSLREISQRTAHTHAPTCNWIPKSPPQLRYLRSRRRSVLCLIRHPQWNKWAARSSSYKVSGGALRERGHALRRREGSGGSERQSALSQSKDSKRYDWHARNSAMHDFGPWLTHHTSAIRLVSKY
jgi:hypothetical protein